MHPSVIEFLKKNVGNVEIEGLEVLEVGSQDVNGSPREVIGPMKPARYLGIDFEQARGVDLVLNVRDLVQYFGADRFDVVLSTEMLEHAQDWRMAVSQMKTVLKPGGLLVITTRGKGFPYHGFPHDYWRFGIEHFNKIFSDMSIDLLEPDPMFPGVFLKARKTPVTGKADLMAITVDTI